MPSPISSIPNLGPASEAAFAKAGIASAEELREIGADEAYRRLLIAGSQPHFIGYYVLVMGLQGRPWNDCQGAEKIALRAKFDAIKASFKGTKEKGRFDLEAALDHIGVIRNPGTKA
jgi:DNA transformation protein